MTYQAARAYRIVTLASCVTLAACGLIVGQDATPNTTESASAQYQAKLEEWKSLLREMRKLQVDYITADEGQAAEIERRWNELTSQGETFMEQLRAAGLAAYAEAPGRDRELERFLVKMLDDNLAQDRYEPAADLSQALLDHGCEIRAVYDSAGVAAFAVNDYDKADAYLKQAEQAGVLSEKGSNFLALLPEYREYWKEEAELREAEAAADDLPRVRITTNKGEMVVELFENEAPETVGNFISLVEKGFYDDLTFHRVLPGFMAQGGCPLGTGSGGPGYNIYCECHQPNHRKHFRGTLSMAHAGRDTGGSQFFLTFVPTAHLNGKHTAFGRVIEGMDVLSDIERINPDDETKPLPDTIVKMEVIRKRDHEYQPNKVN